MANDLNQSVTWNQSEFNQFSKVLKKEREKKQRAEDKAQRKAEKGAKIPKKFMDQVQHIIEKRV